MSAPVASKIRRPSRPSMATKAKSFGLIELDVRALGSQRIETAVRAPPQEHPQIGLGIGTRQALVPGEVPGYSPTKNIGPFDRDRQRQNFHRGSHVLDCAPSGTRVRPSARVATLVRGDG
jgi:hypothetical protein